MNECSQRLILSVNYNGQSYKGWQVQLNPQLPTVQARLEDALSNVAASEVRVHCAGRTDSGVHATSQIVHCVPPYIRPLKAWVQGVNTYLPHDIRVRWAAYSNEVENFHARFSATARSYRYVIHNSAISDALLYGLVTQVIEPLDAEAMHVAAQCLCGEQDFSSFRASGCQSRTAMRNVHAVNVQRHAEFIYIDIKANAFLLHMVRNIVGLLISIGKGKYPVAKMAEVLCRKDRAAADVTAPAHGLYLVAIDYPAHFNLPSTCYLPLVALPNSAIFLFQK